MNKKVIGILILLIIATLVPHAIGKEENQASDKILRLILCFSVSRL